MGLSIQQFLNGGIAGRVCFTHNLLISAFISIFVGLTNAGCSAVHFGNGSGGGGAGANGTGASSEGGNGATGGINGSGANGSNGGAVGGVNGSGGTGSGTNPNGGSNGGPGGTGTGGAAGSLPQLSYNAPVCQMGALCPIHFILAAAMPQQFTYQWQAPPPQGLAGLPPPPAGVRYGVAGTDFVATSGTVTFAPGTTEVTVMVQDTNTDGSQIIIPFSIMNCVYGGTGIQCAFH
jgi:hypothetical protein